MSRQGPYTFDKDLLARTRALAASDDATEPRGVPEAIANAPRRAAAVYRAHDWIADDRGNHFSIAMATTMLRECGAEMTTAIARWYGITWPKSLHFEVTAFAEPFGANTPQGTPDLLLTVMSTHDPALRGLSELEILFHEPLHHFDDQMEARIAAAAKATGSRVPRGFSHALLFHTTGEAARRASPRAASTTNRWPAVSSPAPGRRCCRSSTSTGRRTSTERSAATTRCARFWLRARTAAARSSPARLLRW